MITFSQFLIESRSAPLYHATSIKNARFILKIDKINAVTMHNHDRHMGKDKTKSVVSLTRSFNFAKRWGERKNAISSSNDGIVIFELDQQKLSHNYKLLPYNHSQDDEFLWGVAKPSARQLNDVLPGSDKFPVNQYEENVIGPINNVKKYITKIFYMSVRDDDLARLADVKGTIPLVPVK